MQVPMIGLSALLVTAMLPAEASAQTVTLPECTVTAIEDIDLPAQEVGVLKELSVREGSQVKAKDILAQIDDAQTKLALEVAKKKLEAAETEAEDTTSIDYAKAAHEVAKNDLERGLTARKKMRASVTDEEIEHRKLLSDRAQWEIERATVQQKIALAQAAVSGAEVRAAEESLRRHKIISPIDAVVENVYRHANEWVKPGDPVLQIVQVNRLYVWGSISAEVYRRSQIEGRRVRVRVRLPNRAAAEFDGQICFVSHVITAGQFRIKAEVVNRQELGEWLLLPGHQVEMTIQLKQ